MYGNQAVWLCNLGENAGGVGQDVQRNRTSKCLFSTVYTKKFIFKASLKLTVPSLLETINPGLSGGIKSELQEKNKFLEMP